MQRAGFFVALFGLILAAHLCHVGVLWEPETFPLAAAGQMVRGHSLYSGIWYDKPPLAPLLHLLLGARSGWLLRVAGACYCLLCCVLGYGLSRQLWGERAGWWAVALIGFFLTFDFPASVLPLGPDLLTVAPHLGAVWLAVRGRAFWAGAVASIAFLANTKGLFVLAAALVFAWPSPWPVLLGFALPTGAAMAALLGTAGYTEQVWVWSSLYAASPFVQSPVVNGLARTANWLGFHAALVAGAAWRMPWRFVLWIGLSAVGVALGLRFFPRYYLQLLPPLAIAASYGASRFRLQGWAVGALLLIPAVRFAPRYVQMAQARPWADTAMDADSRSIAARLRAMAEPQDTLFIWGYRPELWVYAKLPDATRFLDSQPLTGVPADRHLTQSKPIAEEAPRQARLELARSRPTFVADGLSLYNPTLSIANYPELRDWFTGYREVARSQGTVLYRRVE